MSLENIKITHEVSSDTHNREEIKELLNEKIEGKVQIIRELWDLVEESKDLQASEFKEKIELAQEKILACFGDNAKEKLREYQKSIIAHDQTYSKQLALIGTYEKRYGEDGYFERDDYLEETRLLEEEEKALENKILELGNNDDVIFLKKVVDFTENVTGKFYETEEEKDFFDEFGKKEFLSLPSQTYFRDITEEEIEQVEVQFAGHCVNIILPKKAYARNHPQTLGKHFGGTVINLIRDSESRDDTIAHEEKHNLTESFVDTVKYSEHLIQELEKAFSRLNRAKEIEAPDFYLENIVLGIEKKISTYHLENLDEAIADMGKPPKESIRSYFNQFAKTLDNFDQYIETVQDEKIKDRLYESVGTLEEKFIAHIRKLADIYFVSEKMHSYEDAQMSILLFGHTLPKVERYMKRKVGKELYEVVKTLRPLHEESGAYFSNLRVNPEQRLVSSIFGIGDSRSQEVKLKLEKGDVSFFSSENLNALYERLSHLREVNEKDFTQAIGVIDSELFKNHDLAQKYVENAEGVEEVERVKEAHLRLGELLHIDGLAESFDAHYVPFYVTNVFDTCFKKDNYEAVEKILNNHSFNTEESFMMLESEQIRNDRVMPYLLNHLPAYCDGDIRKSNYWKFLSGIGFEKALEETLAEIQVVE